MRSVCARAAVAQPSGPPPEPSSLSKMATKLLQKCGCNRRPRHLVYSVVVYMSSSHRRYGRAVDPEDLVDRIVELQRLSVSYPDYDWQESLS